MVLYGMGDHGGGPNPEDIAGIAKLNASPDDVNVKPTNVADLHRSGADARRRIFRFMTRN